MDAANSPHQPLKVIVLGGAGFVGRAVVQELIARRHQVRVLVRDPQRAQQVLPPGTKLMVGDALDPQNLLSACQGADFAVSLVAVRRNQPQSFLEVNVDGPRRLAEACRRTGIKGIVFASAIGASLDPAYRYLSSRFMGEEELRRSNIPAAILRFSLVLGHDGGIVRELERVTSAGPVVVVPGSGETRFQPILRQDAARCVAEAVGRDDLGGKTLNLGGPEILTYAQLLEMFMQARGIRKRTVNLPPQVLYPAVRAMEMYLSDPIVVQDELKTYLREGLADGLDVVAANFGFRPGSPTEWIPRNWAAPLAA